MSSDQPSRIHLRDQGRSLRLHYEHASHLELDAEYLRVNSPSAEVQGHGAGDGELPVGKQHVLITKVELAGNYALRLHFDDGHDSGIYGWSYLKQLAAERPQRWQRYLAELRNRGLARDSEVQVVRVMDPGEGNSR